MKIGLFFGSFNPVHTGHLIIANYMATQTDLDKVWMVVSPQNPLKNKASLAGDYDRLNLVRRAVDGNDKIQASDIEFGLPKPSYTIDTLTYLKEKHPKYEFALIMGGDNIATLHKWKNYEQILENYQIYVYQRSEYELGELATHVNVHIYEAPLMQISATYIRKCLRQGKSIKYLVPDVVLEEIMAGHLYQ